MTKSEIIQELLKAIEKINQQNENTIFRLEIKVGIIDTTEFEQKIDEWIEKILKKQ